MAKQMSAQPPDPEIERCQAEARRANASLDAEIQAHAATKATHMQEVAKLKAEHAKEISKQAEQHARALDRQEGAHAQALARAIAEPPQVRAHRLVISRLQAEHNAQMQEAHLALKRALEVAP